MKVKRMIGLLLSLCLLLSAAVIPAGAAAKKCSCGEVLQVFVDGFGGALYFNEDTPERSEAGIARTDTLLPALGEFFRGAGLALWQRSWSPFASGLGAVVFSILGHLQLDVKGNSVAPITSNWRIDPEQNHKEEPEYVFEYDFRVDPFKSAAQLNDFIETLCDTTGHSKIALTGCSEGAVISMTYLKEYGTDRLETLILLNGAYKGLTLVGELLTYKFAMSGPAITNFISNSDDGSGLLTFAMCLLRKSGLLNFTDDLAQGVLDTMGEQIYDEILIPLFGHMPVVWAFVPEKFYPEARKLISNDPKYAELLECADRYHEQVQSQTDVLLKKAIADGVRVAIIAGYGKYAIPVSETIDYQCDGMIDTAYESCGAVTAPIGKTLPETGSTKYRSPDGIINASTCLLPDQTWFTKNNGHTSPPSHDLRQWIIHSKTAPTITSNPDFPQYLVWNPKCETMKPLE